MGAPPKRTRANYDPHPLVTAVQHAVVAAGSDHANSTNATVSVAYSQPDGYTTTTAAYYTHHAQ